MRAPGPRFHLPTFRLRRRSTEAEQLVESPSAQLQEFLVRLGSALLAIGTASRDIQGTLKRVATALGSPRATLIVFPTLIFVGLPGEAQTRFDVAEASGGEVRFDRAAHVYAVVDRALAGEITAAQGIEALDAIASARPRFNRLRELCGLPRRLHYRRPDHVQEQTQRSQRRKQPRRNKRQPFRQFRP